MKKLIIVLLSMQVLLIVIAVMVIADTEADNVAKLICAITIGINLSFGALNIKNLMKS